MYHDDYDVFDDLSPAAKQRCFGKTRSQYTAHAASEKHALAAKINKFWRSNVEDYNPLDIGLLHMVPRTLLRKFWHECQQIAQANDISIVRKF